MEKIEMLVASMHQKEDDTLYNKMNIKTDAVIANQCDRFSYYVKITPYGIMKMVSTSHRGVGKNRNLAFLYSTGDILMFTDEDLCYYDDYIEIVNEAFSKLKDADGIIFDVDYENEKNRNVVSIKKIKRLKIYNSLRYGCFRFAIKKEALLKANISFSHLFGGGARYQSGEDTIFISDLLKKGLKLYSYPKKIAKMDRSSSSWFEGYNDKYFFDKGALLAAIFPKTHYLFAFVFACKFKGLSDKHNYFKRLKLLFLGMNEFKNR